LISDVFKQSFSLAQLELCSFSLLYGAGNVRQKLKMKKTGPLQIMKIKSNILVSNPLECFISWNNIFEELCLCDVRISSENALLFPERIAVKSISCIRSVIRK
jgi:hypothetical protein